MSLPKILLCWLLEKRISPTEITLFLSLYCIAMTKKVRQCPDKPGSVTVCSQEKTVLYHLSS